MKNIPKYTVASDPFPRTVWKFTMMFLATSCIWNLSLCDSCFSNGVWSNLVSRFFWTALWKSGIFDFLFRIQNKNKNKPNQANGKGAANKSGQENQGQAEGQQPHKQNQQQQQHPGDKRKAQAPSNKGSSNPQNKRQKV